MLKRSNRMNGLWNLDPIYRGFDDPAFEADMKEFKENVARFEAFAAELEGCEPVEGLRQGVELEERIQDLVSKLAEYAMLRQAAETTNSEAGSQMGRIFGVYSGVAGPEAAFKAWAAQLPNLMELVEADDRLREYRFLFANMADSSRYLLSGKGEQIMARMQMSGSSAWSELQQYLTSTVPVTYRGQTLNLSTVRNLASDADPAVRKDAFEAELACYDRIKDAVAYALNSIKLETLSDCLLRGYDSPLERTLKGAYMKRETLDAMFAAMEEYLPKFWQYLKTKAKALGHENGLPWYDLFAPMGSSSTKLTVEEARDYLLEQFTAFDPEIADMIATAFDNEWIDFFPRSGKQGGAFCAGVECIGESRILTNFDGRFSDVVTLAHELGHAFHNQCIGSHRPLNRAYSMPLAETASTFNECVVMASAIGKAADDAERIALIESQLQDTTQIICDIYSRYKFEDRVLNEREEKFMDAQTLCDYMTEAQKQCYGDGLDTSCLHPYMWVNKSN